MEEKILIISIIGMMSVDRIGSIGIYYLVKEK